jgi:hypothetical protein
MKKSPAIRERIVYGCPYCIGPIYFDYNDAIKHMLDRHKDWDQYNQEGIE